MINRIFSNFQSITPRFGLGERKKYKNRYLAKRAAKRNKNQLSIVLRGYDGQWMVVKNGKHPPLRQYLTRVLTGPRLTRMYWGSNGDRIDLSIEQYYFEKPWDLRRSRIHPKR